MTHMKETSIWEASFEEAVSGSLEDEDQWGGKTTSQKNWLIFFLMLFYINLLLQPLFLPFFTKIQKD